MARGNEGRRTPPSDSDQLKRALAEVALNDKARPSIPLSYALDQLDRRYAQPPGAHRDWPLADLIRAYEFQRLEASVKVTRG